MNGLVIGVARSRVHSRCDHIQAFGRQDLDVHVAQANTEQSELSADGHWLQSASTN